MQKYIMISTGPTFEKKIPGKLSKKNTDHKINTILVSHTAEKKKLSSYSI